MISKLLCKLPPWLGGGHRWSKKLTGRENEYYKRCFRCDETRTVKQRKSTKEGT